MKRNTKILLAIILQTIVLYVSLLLIPELKAIAGLLFLIYVGFAFTEGLIIEFICVDDRVIEDGKRNSRK